VTGDTGEEGKETGGHSGTRKSGEFDWRMGERELKAGPSLRSPRQRGSRWLGMTTGEVRESKAKAN
jgi:hypothetical protein